MDSIKASPFNFAEYPQSLPEDTASIRLIKDVVLPVLRTLGIAFTVAAIFALRGIVQKAVFVIVNPSILLHSSLAGISLVGFAISKVKQVLAQDIVEQRNLKKQEKEKADHVKNLSAKIEELKNSEKTSQATIQNQAVNLTTKNEELNLSENRKVELSEQINNLNLELKRIESLKNKQIALLDQANKSSLVRLNNLQKQHDELNNELDILNFYVGKFKQIAQILRNDNGLKTEITLADDSLRQIFSLLPYKDFLACRQVSKQWNLVKTDSKFLKDLIYKNNSFNAEDWKDYFKLSLHYGINCNESASESLPDEINEIFNSSSSMIYRRKWGEVHDLIWVPEDFMGNYFELLKEKFRELNPNIYEKICTYSCTETIDESGWVAMTKDAKYKCVNGVYRALDKIEAMIYVSLIALKFNPNKFEAIFLGCLLNSLVVQVNEEEPPKQPLQYNYNFNYL